MKTVRDECQSEVGEIHAAMKALCAEVSSRAECTFLMTNLGNPSFLLYPRRNASTDAGREMIHKSDVDWDAALEAVRAEWMARAGAHAENTTQAMAEAIMRITFQFGGCTDAQLRGADFDGADVVRYGQAAVERANSIADKGPFVLTIMPAANDVEAA